MELNYQVCLQTIGLKTLGYRILLIDTFSYWQVLNIQVELRITAVK